MNREDYLLELEDAGRELNRRARAAAEAANPLTGLRDAVSANWKWWLPAAAAAGFALARFLRPGGRGPDTAATGAGGAAFWVPTLIKLLPTVTAQVIPVLLSLRSSREP